MIKNSRNQSALGVQLLGGVFVRSALVVAYSSLLSEVFFLFRFSVLSSLSSRSWFGVFISNLAWLPFLPSNCFSMALFGSRHRPPIHRPVSPARLGRRSASRRELFGEPLRRNKEMKACFWFCRALTKSCPTLSWEAWSLTAKASSLKSQ